MTVRRLSSARASVTSSSKARNITGAGVAQRDPLIGDQPHRLGHVELLLRHHRAAAGVQAPDDRHRPDVEHRHVDQSPVGAARAHFDVHGERHPPLLTLPEDAALRRPGGAAGEQQAGDVVGARGERELPAVAACDELLEVDGRGATAGATRPADGHQHRCDRQSRREFCYHRSELVGAEHDRRAHPLQHVKHFTGREPEVDGRHDDAADVRCRHHLTELDAVAAEHRDAVLAPHTGGCHR